MAECFQMACSNRVEREAMVVMVVLLCAVMVAMAETVATDVVQAALESVELRESVAEALVEVAATVEMGVTVEVVATGVTELRLVPVVLEAQDLVPDARMVPLVLLVRRHRQDAGITQQQGRTG